MRKELGKLQKLRCVPCAWLEGRHDGEVPSGFPVRARLWTKVLFSEQTTQKTVKLTFKGKGKKTILETMETMRREAETRGGGMGTVGPAGRRRKAQAGERLQTLKASRFTWEAQTRGRVSVREAEVCWD